MTNKGYVDLNTACVGYQSIVSTAAAKRLFVCGALDLHLLGSSLSCFGFFFFSGEFEACSFVEFLPSLKCSHNCCERDRNS